MAQRKYIRVIGDYGGLGDMAFAEVSDQIRYEGREANVPISLDLTSVPAFDTYATGFVLAQLAVNSRLGADQVFYVNTAPRKDKKSARINNEGEGLVYAKLKSGVEIVAVNSGYSLSLVKPFAEIILALNVDNAGSQFRSRDIFPAALGAVLRGDKSVFGRDVAHTVPDEFPVNRVVYTDGYGNLKCSIDPAAIEKDKDQLVHIHIEGSSAQVPARVGAGIFSVADGEFCFAKGSSGWTLPDGTRREFAEIVKRGGNAAESFRHPEGGAHVEWRLVAR